MGQQRFFLKNTDLSGIPVGSYRLVNRYSGLVLSLSSDATDPAPQWWQVDLEVDYNLSSIAVTNYVDGTRSYQYNVQASTDGVTWTTIATKCSTSVATSAGDVFSVSTTARSQEPSA